MAANPTFLTLFEHAAKHLSGYDIIYTNGQEHGLETPYGLQLTIRHDDSVSLRRTNTSSTPNNPSPNPSYLYRIFPDYMASFAWYDTSWPGNPPGKYHVDQDVLEAR